MKQNEKGFTLLEVMLTAALSGAVMLAVVKLVTPTLQFFGHSQARQAAQMEARVCLETIERMMATGRADTLVVSPGSTALAPGSRADFVALDGSVCFITWSNTPANTVHFNRKPPAVGSVMTDTILASHVTTLSFDIDGRDPAVVNLGLTMSYPLDASGLASSFGTFFISGKTVRMSTL